MKRPGFRTLTVLASLFACCLVAGAVESKQIDCRLSRAAMEQRMLQGEFALPQFRMYDAEGRQVLDAGLGYNPVEFEMLMNESLAAPELTGSELTLSRELAELVDGEGRSLAKLPGAQFTILKYWAEWCEACFEQSDALNKILANHSSLRVNILNIEADPKMLDEQAGVETVQFDASSLSPEILAILRDPEIPEDQKVQLMRELANMKPVVAAELVTDDESPHE